MNTYETIFISPAELTPEKVESALEKVKSIITKGEGKILSSELWGRRRLAYPIQHSREGNYVYILFSAPGGIVAQLDHHYRVTDTIFRGITIKVDPRHLDKIQTSRISPFESPEPFVAPAPVIKDESAPSSPPASVPAAPQSAAPAVVTAAPAESVPPQEPAS
jgi:small subunit ribosomal protein S6